MTILDTDEKRFVDNKRIEDLERKLNDIEAARRNEADLPLAVPISPGDSLEWVHELERRQEQARLDRVKEAQRQAEETERQAKRDRPLQRARDRQLAEMHDREVQLRREIQQLTAEADQLYASQIRLRNEPLR